MKFETSNTTHQLNSRMDLDLFKHVDMRKCFLNGIAKCNNAKGKTITRGDVIEEMVINGVYGLEIIDFVGGNVYKITETTKANELFMENIMLFLGRYSEDNILEEVGEELYNNLELSVDIEDVIQEGLKTLFLDQLDYGQFKIYKKELIEVLFDTFYVEIKNNHVVFKEHNEALCKVTFGLMDIINEKIKNCGIDV